MEPGAALAELDARDGDARETYIGQMSAAATSIDRRPDTAARHRAA